VPQLIDDIEHGVESARFEQLDYTSDEGRRLYETLAAEALEARATQGVEPTPGEPPFTLPLIVFGESLTESTNFFAVSRQYLEQVGERYVLVAGAWDPTIEICDNEVDDDGDQLTDCQDPQCQEQRQCRPEKQRRLDLFVMSQCPFGAQVVEVLPAVLDHFGRNRSKIDLSVRFIGSADEEGELSSMHGPAEVEEDLRQVCVQQLYQQRYLFADFRRSFQG